MLPNLVVIGAAKCGSTSLHWYLDAHPQVQMSRRKETNFFWERWDHGQAWYEDHFDAPGRAVYGESSMQYTSWPFSHEVPGRMAGLIPDARLIYLVRDPVDRLVSEWMQAAGLGLETRPLDVAIRDLDDHRYMCRSHYHEQITRFLEHFPRERLLVLEMEELRDEQRAATLRRVHRFLGIEERAPEGPRRAFNVTPNPRVERAVRLLPVTLRRTVARAATLAGRPGRRPEPSPATRAWVHDQLAEDVEALRAFTGWPLETWLRG